MTERQQIEALAREKGWTAGQGHWDMTLVKGAKVLHVKFGVRGTVIEAADGTRPVAGPGKAAAIMRILRRRL